MELNSSIEKSVEKFKKISEDHFIKIISHLDTEGITSAAILAKALQREDIKFSITIVRQLETELLKEIMKNSFGKKEALFFLDLGTSFIEILNNCSNPVFILDHHQFDELPEINETIEFINSRSFGEELTASGLTFFFSKKMNEQNSDAPLAILGVVGDMQDRDISKMNNLILNDNDERIKIKRGLKIFSAARPVHKALEFGSDIFIPGVTGNSIGAWNMLREIDIKVKNDKGYRTLLDLDSEEISRLVTAIVLRRLDLNSIDAEADEIIGNIYTIKIFNHFEDARELSTLINACGRLGQSDVALGLCLGSKTDKTKAEEIYNKYKHSIIKALTWVSSAKKIEGDEYVIINAKDNIPDTLIGTIVSINASSFLYPKGTILIGMAERSDGKIKVSMRIRGKGEKANLREILSDISKKIDVEDFGGHESAAGCLIPKAKEELFIETLKQELDIKKIKITA